MMVGSAKGRSGVTSHQRAAIAINQTREDGNLAWKGAGGEWEEDRAGQTCPLFEWGKWEKAEQRQVPVWVCWGSSVERSF